MLDKGNSISIQVGVLLFGNLTQNALECFTKFVYYKISKKPAFRPRNLDWSSRLWPPLPSPSHLMMMMRIMMMHHCTMCCLGSMFSFQPNKLRHILKFMSWYTIEHIFVPACSVGRKTWFLRKPWFSNSKSAISGFFFPILSAPKIMFPVPENKKRDKF